MKLIFEQKQKSYRTILQGFSVKNLSFSLAGGVAANKEIRNSLRELCDNLSPILAPPLDRVQTTA